MRQLVESLKRLYHSHKITLQKVQELQRNKSITSDEAKYILSND